MKPYHNSPLLYEKGFSIIINDMAMPMENSTLYYFDYDQRSQSDDDPPKPQGVPFCGGKAV